MITKIIPLVPLHPLPRIAEVIEHMGYNEDRYREAWHAAAVQVNNRLDELWEMAQEEASGPPHVHAIHLRDKLFLSVLNKLVCGKRADDAYLKADGTPLNWRDFAEKAMADRVKEKKVVPITGGDKRAS